MYAELGVKPAEGNTMTPERKPSIEPTKQPIFTNLRTKKDSTMNLLNEALARARMRELWRYETRGYVGRHRSARDIAAKVRKRESL
ncbi:hypothetical protein AB0I28_31275 [Phytomonospora sp. NPDC050363]|uniref:hypothetical protein n=1 Tax=Phytomonospora sp. NPDC050363 TaxID=3155642 RepID=UPI0033D6EAE3